MTGREKRSGVSLPETRPVYGVVSIGLNIEVPANMPDHEISGLLASMVRDGIYDDVLDTEVYSRYANVGGSADDPANGGSDA